MTRKASALKTALFVLTLLTVALVPSLPAQDKAADPAPYLGDWNGTISIAAAGMEVEFTLHLTLNDQKELAGTIDVPAQGAMGLPLEGFKIEAKAITFLIGGVPGEPMFKGTLDEIGKKLSGTFSQSTVEGTFQAVKAGK